MANSKLVKYRDKVGNSYPFLYIDLLSGTFYVRIRFGDKIRSASLETNNLNEARNKIKSKIAELQRKVEVKTPLPENVLVIDYIRKMIAEKEASEAKESTMRRIKPILEKSIEPFWAFIPVEDVNQELVIQFMAWHRRIRPGIQFVNVFKYLGNIFNNMEKDGIFVKNKKPVLELPLTEKRHHAKQKGRYITDDEIKKILKHSDPLTKLFIAIAYSTGMRKMEIGALELSRLKLHGDHFAAILDTDDTKTGLARIVPMPTDLTPLIAAQINKESKYLFYMKTDNQRHMSGQLIDKGWIEAKKQAEITGRMRVHDLRHTAASNMAKSNINPIIAVTVLGMRFDTYQKTYLKLSITDLVIASETNFARLRGLHD